ncbi:MAG TPA: hypothetical protein P5114_12715 [Hyphomicrobiaceae bacterium]|nr:hypothetical protein [Hyphomicrobiaceae bacterium]
MQQRHGVCSVLLPIAVARLRYGAIVTAAFLVSLLWLAISTKAGENNALDAAPPPSAGMEPGNLNAPRGPAIREDEPTVDGEREPQADEVSPPPYQGGCPYRGRKLELIV